MSGFDRELIVARSRAPQVCEIETIDCIHDQGSQKRARQSGARPATFMIAVSVAMLRVVKAGPADPSQRVNP
jgi:hypothetical protein